MEPNPQGLQYRTTPPTPHQPTHQTYYPQSYCPLHYCGTFYHASPLPQDKNSMGVRYRVDKATQSSIHLTKFNQYII